MQNSCRKASLETKNNESCVKKKRHVSRTLAPYLCISLPSFSTLSYQSFFYIKTKILQKYNFFKHVFSKTLNFYHNHILLGQ